MNPIIIVVNGDPVPQPRHRIATRGKFARAYIPKTHAIHAWKDLIIIQAKAWALATGHETLMGPVRFLAHFRFARPKNHLRTNGELKPWAKDEWPTGDGDFDNLTKAAADALTQAGIWKDDRQVVRHEFTKQYVADNQRPGLTVAIYQAIRAAL